MMILTNEAAYGGREQMGNPNVQHFPESGRRDGEKIIRTQLKKELEINLEKGMCQI